MPGPFYFGCWNNAGHYIHQVGGHKLPLYNGAHPFPWDVSELDGGLCPGVWHRPSGHRVKPTEEIQGLARLHHRQGWTAMAFWDRSVDTRGGCNSVFMVEGEHDFEKMCALFQEHFPTVWKRFKFQIVSEKS